MQLSTLTSIYLEWVEATPSTIPILGYKVYQSAGTNEFSLIFDQSQNPLVREFNATGLETGLLFQFRIAAVYFNGDSEMSPSLVKYSCLLPERPEVPYRVVGDETTITLRWEVPLDDGGCPLTGFNLYRDDGN
jgi:hypothetical protein